MSRGQKKITPAPRLHAGGNAERIMRTLIAACNAADLRRMAADPHGRSELQRMQRVAAARVEEFQRHLALAKEVEAHFTRALQTSTLEA